MGIFTQNNNKLVNVVLSGVMIAYVAVTLYVFTSNHTEILFTLRRKDLVGAAMKVEAQEKVIINTKILEVRRDSVKRVLSPLVVK